GPRRCRQPGRDLFARRVGVEGRMQQLVERRRVDAGHRDVAIDQALALHVDGDLQRRFAGALAAPGLEHEELAFLHREFEVLHVAIMALEPVADRFQFGEGLRHRLFHRRLLGALALAHDLGDRLRRADAGNDILALGVDEELAIEQLLAGRGIAGEGDARGAGLAAIAEHHRLHRHRRAPLLRDAVQPAIGLRPVRLPGAEHRADRAPELFVHVLRERPAEFLMHPRLEQSGDALQILGAEFGVEIETLFVLLRVQDFLEQRMFDAQHDVGIHVDEAAIGIVGEARIAGEPGEAFRGLGVEAEIENRVHHARHRDACARSNRNEQRPRRIAELAAGQVAHPRQRRLDLGLQRRGVGPPMAVEIGADLGGDRKAGRNRHRTNRPILSSRTSDPPWTPTRQPSIAARQRSKESLPFPWMAGSSPAVTERELCRCRAFRANVRGNSLEDSSMNENAIFAPMGVLAGITFFVLLFVPAWRFIGRGQPVPQDSATGDIPGGMGNPNFADLLEMPVLFYVVCLMAVMAGRADATMLWLAWTYVVLRALHSAVHLTYDNPTHRTALFALSNFAVLAMWVSFFFVPPGA